MQVGHDQKMTPIDFDVRRSRSWWPCEVKNGFRSITEEHLGRRTPYLVWRFAMPSKRPLLVFRSVHLKSTSRWPWAERSQWQWADFCLALWLWPLNLILGVQVGHHQQMTLIDFEVKGQGHGNLQLKNGFRSITKECLCWGTSYLVCRLVLTSRWPLYIVFDFEVTRSNVKVTLTMSWEIVFA